MNKKLVIQLIVISGAFIGAGVILYNGFFKNDQRSALVQSLTSLGGGQAPGAILPYGNNLDFSILNSRVLYYNQVTYPKLESKDEYGISEEDLIKAPSLK